MESQISSINRALEILCLFDSNYPELLSAQEISKLLKVPLSSTYKYLNILIEKQFLRKEAGDKKYRLGLMVYKLSRRFIHEMGFLDVARSYMKSLSDFSGETVFISVVDGWNGLIIEKAEPSKPVKLSVERGSILPLHAGAAQKVLLAYQKDSFLDAYIKTNGLTKMMPNTITDPDELRKELETIKEQGFAYSDSEVESWAMAIAAPVFDHEKRILAGLTIAVPSHQERKENLQELIGWVKDCSLKISRELGYKNE